MKKSIVLKNNYRFTKSDRKIIAKMLKRSYPLATASDCREWLERGRNVVVTVSKGGRATRHVQIDLEPVRRRTTKRRRTPRRSGSVPSWVGPAVAILLAKLLADGKFPPAAVIGDTFDGPTKAPDESGGASAAAVSVPKTKVHPSAGDGVSEIPHLGAWRRTRAEKPTRTLSFRGVNYAAVVDQGDAFTYDMLDGGPRGAAGRIDVAKAMAVAELWSRHGSDCPLFSLDLAQVDELGDEPPAPVKCDVDLCPTMARMKLGTAALCFFHFHHGQDGAAGIVVARDVVREADEAAVAAAKVVPIPKKWISLGDGFFLIHHKERVGYCGSPTCHRNGYAVRDLDGLGADMVLCRNCWLVATEKS